MDLNDQKLLDIYMDGFSDGFYSLNKSNYKNELFTKAYNLGYTHAIIGDDCREVDYYSDEQILNLIKNE